MWKMVEFRFTVDWSRKITVPIGFVFFNEEKQYVKIRLPTDLSECPKEIGKSGYALIGHVYDRLKSNMDRQDLPTWRGERPYPLPHEDRWWKFYKDLLIHSVSIGETCGYPCFNADPDSFLESEFKRLVKDYS